MTAFEIWSYIFGGATVFALIVGVLSIWNGRMTRRELTEVTERAEARTQAILNEIREHMRQMDEHMKRMDERHTDYFEKTLEKVG